MTGDSVTFRWSVSFVNNREEGISPEKLHSQFSAELSKFAEEFCTGRGLEPVSGALKSSAKTARRLATEFKPVKKSEVKK